MITYDFLTNEIFITLTNNKFIKLDHIRISMDWLMSIKVLTLLLLLVEENMSTCLPMFPMFPILSKFSLLVILL